MREVGVRNEKNTFVLSDWLCWGKAWPRRWHDGVQNVQTHHTSACVSKAIFFFEQQVKQLK